MARVAWAEIDGWGVVRKPHALTSFSISGQDLLIPTAQTPSWGSGDVGLYVQIRRRDGTARQEARGVYLGDSSGARVVRLLPGSGTPSLGGTTQAWLEDPFRICDTIPPWWTVDASRWIDALGDMTRVLSDALPEGGGVGAAQSMRLSVLYGNTPDPRLQRLARTWAEPAARLGAGLTVEDAGLLTGTAEILPADGALEGEVVQVGTECLYVVDDGDPAEVLRGVLRTQIAAHPSGSPVHAGLATGIGQIVRVFIGDTEDDSAADARMAFVGLIDAASYASDLSELSLQCHSLLSLGHSWSPSQRVRASLQSARYRLPTDAERDAISDLYDDSATDARFSPPRVRQRTFFRAVGPVPEEHRWVVLAERLAYQLIEVDRIEEPQGDGTSLWVQTFILRGDEPRALITSDRLRDRSHLVATGRVALLDEVDEYVSIDEADDLSIAGPAGGALIASGGVYVNLPEGPIRGPLDRRPAVAYSREGAEFGWVFGYAFTPPSDLRDSGWRDRASRLYSPSGRHVAEILLEVLTSTGTGRNAVTRDPAGIPYPSGFSASPAGNYDRLPASFGLGIPTELVDAESFYLWATRNPDAVAFDLWIGQEDAESIADWMTEHILGPLGLALVSTDGARIALVDAELLTDGQDYDLLPVFTSDDVTTDSPNIPRNGHDTGPVVLAAGAVLSQREVWQLRSEDRPRRLRIVSGTERFGLSVPLARVARDTRTVEVTRGTLDEGGWSARTRAWLVPQRGMVSTVTVEMREEAAPRIGDRVVLSAIPVYPGTDGARGLTGLAQCVQTDVDLVTGLAVVRFRVSWVVDVQPRYRWAPGGAVLSAPDGDSATIVEHAFVPIEFADADPIVTRFRSDRECFVPGSRVILTDELYELRDAGPAVVDTVDLSTGVVTFDPGFSETPQGGDFILLAAASEQPAAVLLQWAFGDGGARWL